MEFIYLLVTYLFSNLITGLNAPTLLLLIIIRITYKKQKTKMV